ncbi:MAG: zinc-ribbon domain-containing protein [Gammaproteobacteria bacterium]|nr:zinc-ribbon domain-containing protein [Gammaproteobacteria bacterium]
MLTRCPQCQAIYPLGTDELTRDKGRVRCSRCRSVFYALEHLQPAEDELDPTSAQSSRQSSTQANSGPPELIELANPEPEPQAQAQALSGPDIEPPSDEALLERLREPGPSRGGWLWGLMVLLLSLTAGAQWIWLERAQLLQEPRWAHWLEQACAQLQCRLPPRRDLAQISVLQRQLHKLDEQQELLRFELSLVNQAGFAQPYPYLELSLFDRDNRLAGRRIFTPAEYLGRAPSPALLAPQQPQNLSLDLHEPEGGISGFEFRFL